MRSIDKHDSSNLDLLRAFAVLAVFVDHLAFTLAGPTPGASAITFHFLGHAGVLIFFVHTSLVLMRSMERMHLSGWPLFWSFMVRRSFRIYPLSILVVLLVLILHIPAYSDGQPYHPFALRHWLSSIALVQNVTGSPQVLDPLWSLPFEIQMYCALPLIFLTVAWRLRRIAVVYAVSVLSIFAVFWAVSYWALPVRGLLTLRFVPCFLAGVLAYAAGPTVRPRFAGALWGVFLALAVCAYCFGGPEATGGKTPLQFTLPGMLCGWALCAVLGFAIPRFKEIRSRWLKRGSHVVAKYSYGIYLTHVPVFWFCFWRLKHLPFAAQCLLAAALSGLLPVVAFHTVENPCINFGKRLTSRGKLSPARSMPLDDATAAA
jgi:peptidoglycan/LPS O-acetylase OafA/YrhL